MVRLDADLNNFALRQWRKRAYPIEVWQSGQSRVVFLLRYERMNPGPYQSRSHLLLSCVELVDPSLL